MNTEIQPYKIISSKFLGRNEYGHHTYELTFNQSIVHIGRWTGIEDGLNAYRENEMKEEEQRILQEANRIREKYGMPLHNKEQGVKESDTTKAQSMDEPLLPNKKS